jgi:hypothetical protein
MSVMIHDRDKEKTGVEMEKDVKYNLKEEVAR